jgi:hypothetical protein
MRRRGPLGTLTRLVVTFFLTILGFVGILATIHAVGALGAWTTWQFVGLFGLIEASAGLANVFLPNVWRLPVLQLEAGPGRPTMLAASTLLIPHWAGLARAFAGACFIILAAEKTSVSARTFMVIPFVCSFAAFLFGLTVLFARLGTGWPHLDVVQLSVRWNRQDNQLPAVSIGASVLQLILSLLPFPAIKVLSPGALYQPELAPSAALIAGLFAAAVGTLAALPFAWSGRMQRRATKWQQNEAERNA